MEHKKSNGQFAKGNTFGRANKGRIPKNGFPIGNVPWNKGKDLKRDARYAGYMQKLKAAAQERARNQKREVNNAITPPVAIRDTGIRTWFKNVFGII